MRRYIFAAAFAMIALVALAFIAVLIADYHAVKLFVAVLPLVLIIGGGAGFAVGLRADRLHKVRSERARDASQNDEGESGGESKYNY